QTIEGGCFFSRSKLTVTPNTLKNKDVPTIMALSGILCGGFSLAPFIISSKLICVGVSLFISVPLASANAFAIFSADNATLLVYCPGLLSSVGTYILLYSQNSLRNLPISDLYQDDTSSADRITPS